MIAVAVTAHAWPLFAAEVQMMAESALPADTGATCQV
jgi:hypothetical protein